MGRPVTQSRVAAVIRALPQVFVLTPHTDYQKLISHSPQELAEKAWDRTGAQMHHALRVGEVVIKHVRRID